jgi:hypothetical protein
MTAVDADVLMITYERPDYVRRSLPHLLEGCESAGARVWLWHNGNHAETLEIVADYARHPIVSRFHHSPENVRLWEPTQWLWTESRASLVGKVDDDCLPDPGWLRILAGAHADVRELGVVACWRFADEDYRPDLAEQKIRTLAGGHRILENLWVQGSGHLVKRRLIDEHGPLRRGQSFTQYCKLLARRGCVNGWYVPFVREEHMDDPRSPHTLLHTDADLQRHMPLSAQRLGITTLDEWAARHRYSAFVAQTAPTDPAYYSFTGKAKRKLASLLGRGVRAS